MKISHSSGKTHTDRLGYDGVILFAGPPSNATDDFGYRLFEFPLDQSYLVKCHSYYNMRRYFIHLGKFYYYIDCFYVPA